MGILCRDFHNLTVRNVRGQRVQVDEIWSFVGCREKAHKAGAVGHGDAWVWVGMDADSKLVPSYMLGGRDAFYASQFLYGLADRLDGRFQ